MCDWAGQYYKRLFVVVISSGADGKMCTLFVLTRSTRVRIHLLANFFLPFQISNHIRKAFLLKKNEGNNQEVENKVSGRCREGFIVPIRWHPFNNLN